MRPPGERRVIVHVVPVRHQRAPERLSQQLFELLVGVPRADLEQHVLRGAGHLQPGVHAVDAPASVVLMHHRRGLHRSLDLLIRRRHRSGGGGRASGGLIEGTLCHLHPAQGVQHLGDFAFWQTQAVVQVLGGGNEALPQSVGRRAPLAVAQLGMFAPNILPTRRAEGVG